MTTVRNLCCVPDLSSEGVYEKSLATLQLGLKPCWEQQLTPSDRLSKHHTLSSARRHTNFKPFRGLVPQDNLDLVLTSTYNQSVELFADKVDVNLQPETLGDQTWRKLKNNRVIYSVLSSFKEDGKKTGIPYKYNSFHPVFIGGIRERGDPNYVKLMNSGHHAPQTNAGYSRQSMDGTFFQY